MKRVQEEDGTRPKERSSSRGRAPRMMEIAHLPVKPIKKLTDINKSGNIATSFLKIRDAWSRETKL